MKKIIFCFTMFLIAIIGVSAETFNADNKMPDHTIRVTNGVNTYDDYLSLIVRSNGDPVYCINPYEVLNTNNSYNSYNYNNEIFNLSDDMLAKLNLIAYYGYGYPGHYENKWYGVTQYLIWKELGIGDIYYTDRIGGVKIEKYSNEIKELERLVNNYYRKPSFAGRYYEHDLNTQYSIVDNSGIINNYEVYSPDLDVTISNSRLNINTTDKEGVFEVKFIKKSPIEKQYLLYNLSGAQSLLYPGKFDIEFSIFVEVSNRTVEIHKMDSEGINRQFASLEGAVYELYNTVGRIGKLVTNKDGIAKRGNLPVGDYYIKEVTPSTGYKLDTNTYRFRLDRHNRNEVIISYEDIIKGNLDIEKYYGEDGVYQYEDGATFEIYDTNNNYIDTIKTKDGYASKKLDYGQYIVKQTESVKGYKKVEDIHLDIKQEKDYKYVLYNEKEDPIVEEPKVELVKQVLVPNTGIHNKNYNYLYPMLFIVIGTILVIIGMKKATLLK